MDCDTRVTPSVMMSPRDVSGDIGTPITVMCSRFQWPKAISANSGFGTIVMFVCENVGELFAAFCTCMWNVVGLLTTQIGMDPAAYVRVCHNCLPVASRGVVPLFAPMTLAAFRACPSPLLSPCPIPTDPYISHRFFHSWGFLFSRVLAMVG